jgi:cell wall-associated NlpC family hydrolase
MPAILPKLDRQLYADLIGKPFKLGSRGPDAFDCVGLVLEMAHRLGLEPPNYLSCSAEFHRQAAEDYSRVADCPKLKGPETGAMVLLRDDVNAYHLGLMVDGFRFLHTRRDTGCIVSSVLDPLWRPRILGFYQLRVGDKGIAC